MKRITFLFFSLFLFGFTFQNVYATSVVHITLEPGWSVFSVPQTVDLVSLSNGGNGISFFQLEGGKWSATSIAPTPENITPLTGFAVHNANADAVYVSVSFAAVHASSALHQKSLAMGWNLVGIAHSEYNADPTSYSAITGAQALDYFADSGYASVVDFTESAFQNSATTKNAVAGITTIDSATADTSYFHEFKAYGIFVNESATVFGGTQPVITNERIDIYAEEDNQNAFALTEKFAEIEYQVFDFGNLITSINGLAADSSHYWGLYINDEFSLVGASDVTLKKNDKVSWVYTSF